MGCDQWPSSRAKTGLTDVLRQSHSTEWHYLNTCPGNLESLAVDFLYQPVHVHCGNSFHLNMQRSKNTNMSSELRVLSYSVTTAAPFAVFCEAIFRIGEFHFSIVGFLGKFHWSVQQVFAVYGIVSCVTL